MSDRCKRGAGQGFSSNTLPGSENFEHREFPECPMISLFGNKQEISSKFEHT